MNQPSEAAKVRQTVLAATESKPNLRVAGSAFLGIIAGALFLSETVHWRQAALFMIGGALGLVLYHVSFGFTTAWRLFLFDRRGAGLRSHLLLLALTSVMFLPALSNGSLFGRPVTGYIAPVGLGVLVGAFIFGVGMQLGGG